MSGRVPTIALAVLFTPGFVPAQTAAAPGKMSFDVASIRQSKPGTFTPPDFALDNGDSYAPFPNPHGLFTADFPLSVYIGFAYKLWLTSEQAESLLAHLPKWVATDRFEIHAKAEGNPTKDQMRLMLQSLLADRFKLAVHFEARETRVFALVLNKPGITGPGLRPHAEGPPCDVTIPARGTGNSAGNQGVFPRVCGMFMLNLSQNRNNLLGSRDATMKQIAESLAGEAHRPVIDQTGLSGRFDFRLEWTPESNVAAPPGADAPVDSSAVTYAEALNDQLGIRLKPTTALINVLVIDHVERPSEN